jgi:pimeloyl-ACP methyl ester carboxylesterase
LLLLIAGGSADAGVYEPVAACLAGDYTVVTYDPRGNSRSPLDGPWEDQRIEVHSDDAHRLLGLLAAGPAYVFGSSSGAIVGARPDRAASRAGARPGRARAARGGAAA